MGFFRPFGAGAFPASTPTACAVGCILSPLRGWGGGGSTFKSFSDEIRSANFFAACVDMSAGPKWDSFAPSGLAHFPASAPTACAVGCILVAASRLGRWRSTFKSFSDEIRSANFFAARMDLRAGPKWDSFAPAGLGHFPASAPTACAVGCILSPLCGWGGGDLLSKVFRTRFDLRISSLRVWI
jgi:hypothetical protein